MFSTFDGHDLGCSNGGGMNVNKVFEVRLEFLLILLGTTKIQSFLDWFLEISILAGPEFRFYIVFIDM
jgi:hypothetical protein